MEEINIYSHKLSKPNIFNLLQIHVEALSNNFKRASRISFSFPPHV